jgi:hypothetical protein
MARKLRANQLLPTSLSFLLAFTAYHRKFEASSLRPQDTRGKPRP